MTIHSDWSRILYDECPEAFHATLPRKKKFSVGVVDGHLQLMRLSASMQSWENFIRVQFIKPIRMLYDAGCKRVVLCFDSYDSVPVYKNMTQNKRKDKHEVKTFHAHQELPEAIPEDIMPYLMNRTFKTKVIELVIAKLPSRLKLEPNQIFILDYKHVVEYTHQSFQHQIPVVLPDFHPMGESDVKFCRYVEKYGNALIHAIDGDYMIIALLFLAQHTPSIHANNNIFIYRQFASPLQGSEGGAAFGGRTTTTTATATGEFRKRRLDAETPKKPVIKAQKKMCWVDMQLIFVCLTECFHQSIPSGTLVTAPIMRPSHHNPPTQEEEELSQQQEQHQEHVLREISPEEGVKACILLMLMAGTDFSRSLPLLGPKRLWDMLPSLALDLYQATSASEGSPLVTSASIDIIVDAVVATAYGKVFENHVSGCSRDYDTIRTSLQKSKLSNTTKERLPSKDQVICTVKNLHWIMKYWSMWNGCVETPLEGQNGYTLAEDGKSAMFIC